MDLQTLERAAAPDRPAEPAAQQRALRFLTAGSVDDGKSTLIGRLLLDSRAILADQLDTLERRRETGAPIDLSLLTDGLEAEREQGITIDVAYRYFATRRRKFIIADAPGHEQYTRNMVTAAAGSDAAVVLVDLTKLRLDTRPVELLPQTRRHTLLAHLLGVRSIVFAVNKLDAVGDAAAEGYGAVRDALRAFTARAGIPVAGIVPVSALRGDNITQALDEPWYRGPSLLQLLEGLPAAGEDTDGALWLPVQYVGRPAQAEACRDGGGERHRTFWGRIARGRVAPGDDVEVFPSGLLARVAELRVAGGAVDAAEAGQSVGVVLDRQVDVSRGDWIGAPGAFQPTQRFRATLAWLDTEPAAVGRKYQLRHAHRWTQARIVDIEHRLDVRTLDAGPAREIEANEIGRVVIETQQPLPLSAYTLNRVAGASIVVDAATHRTSGAVLVEA